MTRLRLLVPLAVVVALAVTGCGAGTTTSPAADAPPTPSAAATGSAAPAPTGPGASAGSGPAAEVPEQLRFTGSTVDGTAFSGRSLAGRPVVLWFWAPWCTVCRGEAPDIEAVQRRFGDRVQFVGVPGLGEVDAMRRFVSDTGLSAFPHVVDDDGALWAKFGVTAQPAFAFVSRNGEVETTAGVLSAEELTARLDRLARS